MTTRISLKKGTDKEEGEQYRQIMHKEKKEITGKKGKKELVT
jgi:hypothetical protein